MPYGPAPKPAEERFWDKVAIGEPDACWEWQGAVQPSGYGFMHGGIGRPRWVLAHRLSWEMHNGPIPEGLAVLHRCDNPPCVNPAHLWLGTRADNNRDRGEKGRGREARQRGAANTNAKLTEDDVRQIIAALQELPRRSQTEIAQQFGIKQPQVSRIMLRQNWAHLWDE